MTDISKFMAEELADAWEMAAANDKSRNPQRRETLRECADVLRMLANRPPARCPRAPEPFNYCPDCDGSFPCQITGRRQLARLSLTILGLPNWLTFSRKCIPANRPSSLTTWLPWCGRGRVWDGAVSPARFPRTCRMMRAASSKRWLATPWPRMKHD